MILFKKDWDNNNAIIDTNTSNKSFLRLASLYKTMGVENHAFILSLYDKDLVGVDPHADDLTEEQIAKIVIESKLNPWYFFREVFRVPSAAGSGASPLEANRGNITLLWLFFNHITVNLIQIRQTGKSLTNNALTRYLTSVRCVNTEINLMTKDSSLRLDTMRKVDEMEKVLPWYFRLTTRDDAKNTEMLSVKALKNVFKGHVPRASPVDAVKTGRGLTSPIFLVDEGPFQVNIDVSLTAALAAGGAARSEAQKKGEPWGTILTTTAGDPYTKSGAYMHGMVFNSTTWNEKYLDCVDLTSLEETIRKNNPKGVLRINATFNHRQLGKSDEWLANKLEEAEADTAGDADIERDFFNKWVSSGSRSPIDKSVSKIMSASEIDPLHTEIHINNFVIAWYVPSNVYDMLDKQGSIVLAVDTSDAVGSDAIAMYFTSVITGSTLATGIFNETNLIVFGEFLADLLIKYPNITLIIERKSSAVVIIDLIIQKLLSRNINPFRRMFNWIVQEKEVNREAYEEIDNSLGQIDEYTFTKNRKTIGYATAGSGKASRSNLYGSSFSNTLKENAAGVKDKTLINQILSLVVRNGRIDHAQGENDDLVIAFLLAHWFLSKGKNLDYYGINTNNIYRNRPTVNTSNKTMEERYDEMEQLELKMEINELTAKLETCKDSFKELILEKELRAKSSKLSSDTLKTFSIDQLLKDINNQKKQRKRNNRYM